MPDRIYKDDFPERWFMVHRDDCTLLARMGDIGPPVTICASPKLVQGEAWLATAKEIAHAMAGNHQRELDQMFDEFCDNCGIGPPHDENDHAMLNIRALRPWKCDQCNHSNQRPKAETQDSSSNLMTAFAEIERLSMTADEGSLEERAERIWKIARGMQGKPVSSADPLSDATGD